MKHIPQCHLDQLLATLHPPTVQQGDTAPPAVTELAAVDSAVTTHLALEGALPENMFAPFTIPATNTSPNSAPTVHWGNVDTGSMVNILYSGVLQGFPELEQFKKAF